MKAVYLGILAALMTASCDNPQSSTSERLKNVDVPALRDAAGRLNRDFFAAPGMTFVTLKRSKWPVQFVELKPRTITAYRDGVAVALGGEAGTTEWGIFVVPNGLSYAPATTKMMHYDKIDEGVYYYRSIRD